MRRDPGEHGGDHRLRRRLAAANAHDTASHARRSRLGARRAPTARARRGPATVHPCRGALEATARLEIHRKRERTAQAPVDPAVPAGVVRVNPPADARESRPECSPPNGDHRTTAAVRSIQPERDSTPRGKQEQERGIRHRRESLQVTVAAGHQANQCGILSRHRDHLASSGSQGFELPDARADLVDASRSSLSASFPSSVSFA